MQDDFCRDCGHYFHSCLCTEGRTDTPRTVEEVDAMDAADAEAWDLGFVPERNDQRIGDLVDSLEQQFARPQSVLDAEAARAAFESRLSAVKDAVERCPHGTLTSERCDDCGGRGRVSRWAGAA